MAARKSTSRNAARDRAIAEQTALLEKLAEFQSEHDGEDGEDVLFAKVCVWSERYSENNANLIVMQAPNATEIRGYRDWQTRGRQVRKGEHGIRILAPAGQGQGTEPTEATAEQPATEGKPGRRFFKLISVFDVAQTDEVDARELVSA